LRGMLCKLSRSKRMLPLFVSLAVIAMLSLYMVPKAEAALFPTIVRGFVWDSAGTPVEGADVSVSTIQGVTTRGTYTDTTDANGFYSVTFPGAEWDVGDTIKTTATFSGNQEDNETIAADAVVQWVNVTYTFEIPEFGSSLGLIAAGGMVGLVAVVVLVWRRK